MILLDTNVISEIIKQNPDGMVLAFLRTVSPDAMFTAAVCEAEIRYGLARMAAGHRRKALTEQVDTLFATAFSDQVLPFAKSCAAYYGELRASREASGRPIGIGDAMIAAIARAHGARLATRNVADFTACSLTIINPWLPPP